MAVPEKISRKDRIAFLRKELFQAPGDPCIGDISLERVRIYTKSCQENPGLPAELQRAKGLAKVLDEIPIYILDGDLIAGNAISRPRAVEVFPEFGVDWILEEIDTFETREADKYRIAENDKKELKEICEWWQGKTVKDRIRDILPEEEYAFLEKGLCFHSNPGDCSGNNTVAIDYTNTVFKHGLNGIIYDVESRMNKLDLTDPTNLEKHVFYRSVLISLKAVIRYAHRYAELASKMAQEESNPFRKMELETIAKNCDWVPANPPRNYWEALQTVQFLHAVYCLNDAAFIFIPGRMDQYLYPYYRKDLDEGLITRDQAMELLECQFIKYNDSKILWKLLHALYFSGNPTLHVITIGGLTPEGNDATNDLSYLILECFQDLRLRLPELSVALHKGTPDKFLREVARLIRVGTAHPKIGVLETMMAMKANEKYPYTIEELRSICWSGCGEITIPGKDRGGADWAWTTGPMVSLELALNNGVSRLTGKLVGLQTGDPKQFKSYEDIWEAWKKQMAYAIKHTIIHRHAMLIAHGQVCPSPIRSVFIDDCIERGKDLTKGGPRYNAQSGSNVGVTTCGDALAALKKLVFDEKKIALPDLIDALDANFEGYEEMRQILLGAPKFGNDDDYVDSITHDLARFCNLEHRQYPELYGGVQRDTYAAVTGGVPIGRMCGATPDGRKAGEPLNEGGISPHQGRDKNGPTAAMKSVSKIDWKTPSGGVFNQKFTTNALKGEEGLSAMMALLRSYVAMGGYHVQFNVVDLETLLDAQIHPENYQDLLVRVGAYCSYYTQLPKVLQDQIIARTAHESVC